MAREIDLGTVLRAVRQADPGDVVDTIATAAAILGGFDVVVYLVDFGQQVLEPLPDRSSHLELPRSQEVATTVAGRAFLAGETSTAIRNDGTRVFVPVTEGTDVTGVLAITVREAGDALLEGCRDLGLLAGYLIATQARVTDLYNLHRRREPMSLAANMQWDLLPPLTLSSRCAVAAGMLEPAYEVGGDCFDYALNGSRLDLAIMDAMGHGLHSAMVAGLAMSSYRHDRRESRTLEGIHVNLDAVIAAEGGDAFVTGQIGQLDLTSGTFMWVNAGHPAPMLFRDGRVAGLIEGPVAVPWGVGGSSVAMATTVLEPGDLILFYTDGVSEARGFKSGAFGTDRLADLVGRHSSGQLGLGLMVRNVVRAVVEHHDGRLRDDAALLAVKWLGPPPAPGRPIPEAR